MESGEDLTFPFLAADSFECACQAFVRRVDAAGGGRNLGWLAVEYLPSEPGRSILRISKSINVQRGRLEGKKTFVDGRTENGEDSQEDLIEDDDRETLIRDGVNEEQLAIDYDIALSTSYNVPVMYFLLKGAFQVGPAALDDIYNFLVPHQHQQSLKSNGVMGGISFGYHPQSGIPAYFVHPCNTASAMKAIAGDKNIEPEDYLPTWLGLVGGCINLSLPSRLFVAS
ncbi:conserved hypothetical protein [Talaromyces stipitatus ATCC 10500]|uniref:Ubiquitin-like-conjugating enzyme ATG10 n=1 Tax=Talaromyces stipitatus (strain ATCC 10500 / CBS 375.48 / QM 6759 / NRRL 1006) TaxID=441959 RepID=B8M7F0_TALSN|nr:uncharacterized protein TSTA_035960 [Talaromyces stipitatus ATCC 10500]EED20370.1 conserved hypothetical protein [Talaromyces stipitatus ATCC 10500]